MTKKFMRKVCVSVDVDVQMTHVWVEDQGDDEETLKLAKKEIDKEKGILLDDATININTVMSECADDSMDDQAITKEDGWIHVTDLTDDKGDKATPTSDRRYLDPDYEQSEAHREELEKVGQQRLDLGPGEAGDAD